jgi:UTP--glucose-1-phosphate uridylyltransferase
MPGLRVGYYLCFFGMHVLTPALFTLLEEEHKRLAPAGANPAHPFAPELARREKYLALQAPADAMTWRQVRPARAQIALALAAASATPP